MLAGWAADLDAAEGTGIDTLHAWAYPLAGGAPCSSAAAAYGGARPDVAGVHGDQFRDSGYGLFVQGLTPGNYDLAVFAVEHRSGGFRAGQGGQGDGSRSVDIVSRQSTVSVGSQSTVQSHHGHRRLPWTADSTLTRCD